MDITAGNCQCARAETNNVTAGAAPRRAPRLQPQSRCAQRSQAAAASADRKADLERDKSPADRQKYPLLVHNNNNELVSRSLSKPTGNRLIEEFILTYCYNCASVCRACSLHCALSLAAHCRPIVIGPVCGGRSVFVDRSVGGSVITITRNCVHRSSPNWVCR